MGGGGASGQARPKEESPKAQKGGRRPGGAEEKVACDPARWRSHGPNSIGWKVLEVVGGSRAQPCPAARWRRAGTIAGKFVCLFGKWEPGETVARFSLDGVGANGSVWQEGGPELHGRIGGEFRARGRGLGRGLSFEVWLSRIQAVNNPFQVAVNGSNKHMQIHEPR